MLSNILTTYFDVIKVYDFNELMTGCLQGFLEDIYNKVSTTLNLRRYRKSPLPAYKA